MLSQYMGGPISTPLTSILIIFDSFDSMQTKCLLSFSIAKVAVTVVTYSIVVPLTLEISLVFV